MTLRASRRAPCIALGALLSVALARPAAAQAELDPRGAVAREQMARCDGAASSA